MVERGRDRGEGERGRDRGERCKRGGETEGRGVGEGERQRGEV